MVAASAGVELVNQTFLIPANDWRFTDLGIRDRPVLITAEFDVEAGPPVQLILMERADLERLNRGETHAVVAATRTGPHGLLKVRTVRPGDYVVVVENPSAETGAANVRLRVSVDSVESTELPPERQLTIVAISFAVFFGIVTYSARRLWLGVRR